MTAEAAHETEFCIYITSAENLALLEDPWAEDDRPVSAYTQWLRAALSGTRDFASGLRPRRLYFGQEFCQRLLPKADDLRLAIEAARKSEARFSFVTPYVTDDGLDRLKPLLGQVESEWPGAEVVVNDWGVLLYLKETHPGLTPVAGRLLEKMKRDPRFSPEDFRRFFSSQGLRMLRDSNATVPAYQRLLQSYGVGRVEFDNVPQGIDIDLSGAPLRASVYAPFGFVTTGRICFIGSLHAPLERRFRVDTPCRRECRTYEQFLRRNLSPMPGAVESPSVHQVELARKGNTLFFANPELSWVDSKRGFDRLIFTPRLPI